MKQQYENVVNEWTTERQTDRHTDGQSDQLADQTECMNEWVDKMTKSLATITIEFYVKIANNDDVLNVQRILNDS